MQLDPFRSDIGTRVLVAFLGENAHWRTLGGIARASGLTKSDVTNFIEDNKECFVESSIRPGGSVLYGMRHDLRQRALAAASAQETHRVTA